MKKILKIAMIAAAALAAVSCYDSFLEDYDFSACYFASQKPLRTVIADRDMSIEVGVAISGKRNVDVTDWAEFEISLPELVGTGLTLLPEDYYTLSDPSKMTVKKANLPLAVVKVSFTDAFYADPLSTTKHYALPFRIVNSSLDSILVDKDATVVVVKYASTWSGTYCVQGTIQELDALGDPVSTAKYGSTELNTTYTRSTTTLSKNEIVVEGMGNTFPAAAGERIKLTFGADGALTVASVDGGLAVTEATGTYTAGDRLKIDLSYKYVKGTTEYAVQETLLRRQDPAKDLYFEEW